MAEYYRILSYLYRYDKKNKLDCKGFVKAEQKKNGLKITLQIDDERLMEEMKLELCFYWKDNEQWKMWKPIFLEPARHHEETVLFYPAEKLPEKFNIKNQYGVVLFYQEFLFYGSVWIGDEIPVEELLKVHRQEKEGIKQEQEEQVQGPSSSPLEEKPAVGKSDDAQEQPAIVESFAKIADTVLEEDGEVSKKTLWEEPEKSREIIFDENKEPVREEENPYEEKREWVEEQQNEREDDKLSTQSEDLLKNMWIDTEKKAKPVDNIFNPAFRGGYQISVEELAALSPEAGRLSDNQFLAKGYAMYHHLLAGKVIYAGKERYCVGVPGIYENRERYMAQLYQFPIFLSLTENRIKTGGFGYWLYLLQE